MVKLSILDLAYIGEGFSASDALANALDLARHAETAGYTRFWLAEHHNLSGIASAATSVCIGHVAGGTHSIRVGAGGIMLPNHSPMLIAEQFGTLATLCAKAPQKSGAAVLELTRRRCRSAADFLHAP